VRSCTARSRRPGSLGAPSPVRRFSGGRGLRRLLRQTSALRQLHRSDGPFQLAQRCDQFTRARYGSCGALARAKARPKAVFFTHLHPDHTAGVPALEAQTELVFGKAEAGFLARAAVANHFSGKSKFLTIDFSSAPEMAPLGPCVDLFGDGSFWAISSPGHTDDDIAYLINSDKPVLLTGDASHFAWAFRNGVAPRGWDNVGTARGYQSLERLRAFSRAIRR